ncbi:beta-propeller fold lactonase family protein [Kribbella orskensis]|uniref:beta-propeller fold lactonase family protein n=1 Tax=Kribbella TaxID=182639 RepID=UPI0013050D80
MNEQAAGGVTAVAVDAPGKLRVLNRQPNGGFAPCHPALVADGKYLLSANYGSGDIAVGSELPGHSRGRRGTAAPGLPSERASRRRGSGIT